MKYLEALALILLSLAIIVSVGIHQAYRQWKQGWLSGLIETRLAEIGAQGHPKYNSLSRSWRARITSIPNILFEAWDSLLNYLRNTLRSDLTAWRVPSFASFIVIVLIIAFFFLLPQPPSLDKISHLTLRELSGFLFDELKDSEQAKWGELITGAFSGLAVVVIALIVFVAESIRDDNDFERKRVLLQVSFLWPLGLAATIIPFGFLWSITRGMTIVLEALVAVITLWAFSQVIRNLLDPKVRERNSTSLLRSRVRQIIFDSVRERLGNNILLEQIGDKKKIDTLHYIVARVWLENSANAYLFLDASADGWIEDIQLDELRKLGERLDRYARENFGFGLRESGPDLPLAAANGQQTLSPLERPTKKAYLLKRYREEVPPDSIFFAKRRSLLALPQEFSRSPELLEEIRLSIPHIFRFTKNEPSSALLRREMQATKDQLARAIRSSALGEIEELRQRYLEISEEFLELLVRYGGGYTAEQAAKERGNIFADWNEVRWLVSDTRELVIIASAGDNTDVLGSVAFLPFAISARAVQAKDHLLFQQFFSFSSFLYFRGLEKEDDSTKNWLKDKAWRWPKEITDFYIAPTFQDKASTVDDLEQAYNFAVYSLRVFQDLLKASLDKNDVDTFSVVAATLQGLFKHFREEEKHGAELLRYQIEINSDPSQTDALKTAGKRQTIASELSNAIDMVFLALGGRALARKLLSPADTSVTPLFEQIQTKLPTTMHHLAEIYAKASEFGTSDHWGWNFWDLVADGQAHFVDTHSKLNQIFVVRALTLLAAMAPASRSEISLPQVRTLADMAQENRPQGLLALLEEIRRNRSQWLPVLSEAGFDCIDTLRELLIQARKAEEAAKENQTRLASLDHGKLVEFRTEVMRHFESSGRLRKILTNWQAFANQLDKHPGRAVPSVGYNQIDDKNAFILQEHTSYAGWGAGYGQGLAHSEDEIVFLKMIEGAKKGGCVTPGTAIEAIRLAVEKMGLKSPIILQTLNFTSENKEFRGNANFVPKYTPQVQGSDLNKLDGFMGVINAGDKQIPVFDLFVRRSESDDKILVLDAAEFVKWRQYAVDDGPAEIEDQMGMLSIRVVDLNQDNQRRVQIVESNPDWLSEHEDIDGYLRGRVLVSIYEKFEIEILNSSAAACLEIVSESGEETRDA